MSNYYNYQSIKAKIAEKLMSMAGWKVYGYRPDESDAMSDYWSPAYWHGIAEKNGYILVVDISRPENEKVIYEITKGNAIDMDKIRKLESMTMANGASAQEEYTAKKAIEKIMAKVNEPETAVKREIGCIPAHMGNPGRCNWHVEKDGVYIAKGTGILQMTGSLSWDAEDYYKNPAEYKQRYFARHESRYTPDRMEEVWAYNKTYLEKEIKSFEKFNDFIRKVDMACGGMVGKGKTERYEKKTVTEYKEELKPVVSSGELKEGQCFILNAPFNYGCNKGNVYRIKTVTETYINAVKLNGKLTKECNGTAGRGNHFNIYINRFQGFINKGSISFCTLETVKVPYSKEKVVKVVDNEPKATEPVNSGEFTVQESMHTKTGEKIWLVKCTRELSKDEYKDVAIRMKKLGGYYSRVVHAFVFKGNPTELLKSKECNIA